MVGIYFFSILVCTLSSNNSSTHIYKQTWSMNKQMHSNYNKYSGHTYICLAFYIPQKSLLNNLTCSLSITQYLLRVHYVKEENELSKVTKTKNGEAYKKVFWLLVQPFLSTAISLPSENSCPICHFHVGAEEHVGRRSGFINEKNPESDLLSSSKG